MITGKINVPVKLTAMVASNWQQIHGPEPVNLRIDMDQKSASFTPSKDGLYVFLAGNTRFEVQVGGTVTPPPQPEPEVPPVVTPPAAGTLLYDSNTDIDWAAMNGKKIEIGKPYGDPTKPNTKYIRMNASGSPTILFNAATKELTLQHAGKYGRAYLGVCNYNVRVEFEFKLDSCNNNVSIKSRNQHQYNEYLRSVNKPEINDPPGGMGFAIHCDSVENDLEVTHGGGEVGGPSKSLSPKLDISKYHSAKFSCFDKNGKIHIIDELDGKVVSEGDIAAPKQFFSKAAFETWSEIWFRLNATKGGKVIFKNIKVYAL